MRKNRYANGCMTGAATAAVPMSVFRILNQRGRNLAASVLDAVRTSLETG